MASQKHAEELYIFSLDLLADTRIACKNICIFCDSQIGWIGVTDFKDTAPLCKDCSILFILHAALWQAVQTYGGDFNKNVSKNLAVYFVWVKQNSWVWPCVVVSPQVPAKGTTPLSTWGMTRIELTIISNSLWCSTFRLFSTKLLHLDANQNSPVSDHFDKGYAIVSVLVQRLVEEDDPSDAAVNTVVCTEKDLAILSAVLLCVLHPNLGQPLGHAACSYREKY